MSFVRNRRVAWSLALIVVVAGCELLAPPPPVSSNGPPDAGDDADKGKGSIAPLFGGDTNDGAPVPTVDDGVHPQNVSISPGTPLVLGSLDVEVIHRVVRHYSGQIKYCYEKELTRTPGVYGKVVMKWVINGEGMVTESALAETQMNNANVESCLATKIKTWAFPKPKGGGIVVVNYPFVFTQSG